MPLGTFTPGFLFSRFDLAVLVTGGIAAALVSQREITAGFLIAFVLGHFFLFCNVFRIGRKLEYIWAAVFSCLAGATVVTGSPGWVITAISGTACAAVLIMIEMRKPSYHGIGWARINPGLRKWWEEHGKMMA